MICPGELADDLSVGAEFGYSLLREGGRMKRYPEDAWERAMKVQEVILRWLAQSAALRFSVLY